eukprot:CAMPEP_0205833054 /NCGR_PEP_ID=MMETSP0206-20130828/48634_1 /ASSEMBLY_ACC=CAM_ASM_000279 /TAXON_ID=36767 /ORGANISM="Euplotes focardii, Strain TN1" /LENGTH=82 /DNA_ID=CAMNT_0053139103 /DNA_START=162 /DNA_END=407 /DNA_ORIENTATION=+
MTDAQAGRRGNAGRRPKVGGSDANGMVGAHASLRSTRPSGGMACVLKSFASRTTATLVRLTTAMSSPVRDMRTVPFRVKLDL